MTKFIDLKIKVANPKYTLRVIIFNPKNHFVSTNEAKEFWRKEDHISKQKMKDEFCSLFAVSKLVGRGMKRHYEFVKTTKDAANTIIIVPTKYRKEAYKVIQNS